MLLAIAIYLSGQRYLRSGENEARGPSRTGGITAVCEAKLTGRDWRAVFALILLIPVLAVAIVPNNQIFNAYLVRATNSSISCSWARSAHHLARHARCHRQRQLPRARCSLLPLVWQAPARTRRDHQDHHRLRLLDRRRSPVLFTTAAATQVPGQKIGSSAGRVPRFSTASAFCASPAGKPRALRQGRAQSDQCHDHRALLSGLLRRQQSGRLGRRLLRDDADDHLLATPCRLRRRLRPLLRALQIHRCPSPRSRNAIGNPKLNAATPVLSLEEGPQELPHLIVGPHHVEVEHVIVDQRENQPDALA